MFDNGFRNEDIDINVTNSNQNVNTNMNENMNYNQMGGMSFSNVMSPIIEPGREKIINRTFVHEVPQECQFMIEKIL